MSIKYKNVENLKVSVELLNFVDKELLKDTAVSPEKFWSGFSKVVHDLAPKNKELIKIREEIQQKINEWHKSRKGNEINLEEYKDFLKSIGY